MKDKIHSVKYNFIMNFVLAASNIIFPLITFPYVSRVLGVTANGTISFATSVANYFLMVASLGIPTYGVRACAQVRDDREKLTQTAQEIFIINTVTTVLSVAAYLLAIQMVPQLREEKTLFYINCINIVLNLFGMQWLYQAMELYDYITIRTLVFKILSIILMFLLVHQEGDYVIYGAIGIFAASGSNVLNFIRARRYISFRPRKSYNFKRHLRPILTLFAQNLATSIYINLDTVMLGFMKGDYQVGLYSTAVKVKTILTSLVTSLGSVMLPRMAFFSRKGMEDEFKSLMIKAINVTLLMAVPLTVYFVLYSRDSILFLAGDAYVDAVSVMQIITLSVVPIGITNILGVQVLTALEQERYVLYSVTVGAAVDLLLNCFFIPCYGAAGAAVATVIAEFAVLGVQLYFTRGLFRGKLRQLRLPQYIAVTAVSGVISLGVMHFVAIQPPFLNLVISAVIFFGTFLVLLVLIKEPIVMQYWDQIKAAVMKKKNEKNL